MEKVSLSLAAGSENAGCCALLWDQGAHPTALALLPFLLPGQRVWMRRVVFTKLGKVDLLCLWSLLGGLFREKNRAGWCSPQVGRERVAQLEAGGAQEEKALLPMWMTRENKK